MSFGRLRPSIIRKHPFEGCFRKGRERQFLLKSAKAAGLEKAVKRAGGLDAQLGREFEGADKTSIIISHRIGLGRFADRVIVMKNGKVVQEGTHDQLLAHGGEYSRIWREQR